MAVIVNPAIMAAAAAQQKARDAVLARLRAEHATMPSRAIALPDEQYGKALGELVGLAHVLPTGNGRYWLDEQAIARSKARATRVTLILLAFMLSLGASLWALLAALG